jgi:hypothetical protein
MKSYRMIMSQTLRVGLSLDHPPSLYLALAQICPQLFGQPLGPRCIATALFFLAHHHLINPCRQARQALP